MTWLGSTLPAGARPRRRKTKTKRRGVGGAQRAIVRMARKLGFAPKAEVPHGGGFGVCAQHIDFVALGFSSRGALLTYVDGLARSASRRPRRLPPVVAVPGAKKPEPEPEVVIRLPPEKCPPGILRVDAVACRTCGARTGVACNACGGWGYGFRFWMRRGIKFCEGNHPSGDPRP